jgi:TonB-linked SusC/RagA family outer membrane protein
MKRNHFIILLFFLFVPLVATAQKTGDVIVQGVVSSKLDGFLIGVNIQEQDATNRTVTATITDFNGHYTIKVKNVSNKLLFTYTGYVKQAKKIDALRRIDVLMQETTKELNDVVVTASKKHSEGAFAIPQREIASAMQTIDMKEMEGLQVSSVDEALQGRIAGLDIVANSGDPGSGSSMRIRGASSITGSNQPLIVVNGVPYEMSVDASFDYANSNQEQYANMLSINPDDIQEITVLKDAAASAVWGSKGAGGVIMITTKKGYTGPVKVEYSYRYTRTVQPPGMKMLNGDDYTMLMKQEFFNPQQNQNAGNIDEYNYNKGFTEYENFNNNTDWVKAVTQVGNINDHYLTLSGGGERATYRVSGGFLTQNGTIIGQKLNRLSTRSNLEYRVSDRLKFITELSYTYANNDRNYNLNNTSILGIAYKKMPNLSIYKQDGDGNDTNEFYTVPSSSNINNDQKNLVNPVALALLGKNNNKNYRILPTFRLQYDLTDPEKQVLRYNMFVSFDINNDKTTTYLPAILTNNGWSNSSYNAAESIDNESVTVQTNNEITWQPKFENKDHTLLLYGSFQSTEGRSSYQSINSYSSPTEFTDDASVPAYLSGATTSRSHWASLGVLGRLHYSYKSRYILSATLRRDGSTKFGDGNKWGNFPGVSLKWIMSDEPFMKKTNKWLSMLAFRPGWGVAGNQPTAEYLQYSRYGDFGKYIDLAAKKPVTMQLKDLRWETSSSFNYGVDLGLFNDKIQIDANVYTKRTTDLLFQNQTIPNSSGYSSISYKNGGTMDNNGWEFNLYANKIIQSRKFSMDFRFNISNSTNQIVQLNDNILSQYNVDYNYTNGTYLTRLQNGNSFGAIYGFRYKGVYQNDEYKQGTQEDAPVARNAQGNVVVDSKGKPVRMVFAYGKTNEYHFRGGDAKYEDINHDGNINELDIVYLGNSNPLFNGGFGPTFKYENLSVTMFFNYRVGNKIVNSARMYAENMYSTNNQCTSVNWRWRKDGDITNMPRALYQYGYNWLGSDRYVEDGSFLRFKYLTFNYSVPKKQLKKLSLDRVNLYLTINNIFVLTRYTGVDPEVGYGSLGVSTDSGQTPRAKEMTFGLTVGL